MRISDWSSDVCSSDLRVDPRLLNKRQLETLTAGGAFDSIDPNRPGIAAVTETVLATAARLHDQRASGQGGLFGGEGAVEEAEIRPLATARWTLAERKIGRAHV